MPAPGGDGFRQKIGHPRMQHDMPETDETGDRQTGDAPLFERLRDKQANLGGRDAQTEDAGKGRQQHPEPRMVDDGQGEVISGDVHAQQGACEGSNCRDEAGHAQCCHQYEKR